MTPVQSDPLLESGYFKTRLVNKGPWVPCRLWQDKVLDDDGNLISDVLYFASIDTEEVDAYNPPRWPWVRIEQDEYEHLILTAEWARQYLPNDPAANPRRPVSQSEGEMF